AAGLLLDGALHVAVDALVRQLAESVAHVGGPRVDDHDGDEESAHGVQPPGVLNDVCTYNGYQCHDASQTVHAMVYGVGCQDGGASLACHLHCCNKGQ